MRLHSLPSVVSVTFWLVLGPTASATVFLDDIWADGTRNNQNLPTDSAWYVSSSSLLTATTGSMSLSPASGSAVMALTYFTTNSTNPVSLGVGDTLTATFQITLTGVAAQNSSQGFRLGLFDFADSTLSPKRVSADLTSNNSQGNGVQGYALLQNMGVTFNSASPITISKRTTLADSGLLGTSGDYTSLGTGPGATNAFPGFSAATLYTLRFSVQRTNSTSLVITVTWVNTVTGASLSTTVVDASASNFNFDGISLRPSGASSTAATITFSEVKVEVVSSATPPSIDSQPTDQAVYVSQNASFNVSASGSAPLGYQWFYNTNTMLTDATNASLTITNAQLTNGGYYSVLVSNQSGSITSSYALLAVATPVAPVVLTQPQDQTVLPGATATLSVQAGGSEPLAYQWFFNTNTLLSDAADTTLVLTNVQAGVVGAYSVVITNMAGSVTSSFAFLSLNTNPVAPVFATQPASSVVQTGGTAVFTAIVNGTAPLAYQWRRNGSPIADATSATLILTNVQPAQDGSYTLAVSNSVGGAISQPATLTVSAAIPVPWTAYNLVGFGQGTTGGGVLADTDPNYAKVYTATDLSVALSSKTVKIIEIMNDLDLGYNEIEAAAKANSEPFRAHNAPQLHPRLLQTGVSLIDIQKKSGLTIFSANGATIRHATFNIKSSGNVIVRNLKFDQMWEWDEASKGSYDKNDWDFIDLGNSGTVSNIWIDHCTFTKAYDGVCDIKSGSFNITFSWNRYMGDDGATNTNSWVWQQINSLESNKTSHAMYNFLRNNGFSPLDIVTIIQGHDKTHLVGATTDAINAQHTLTFHHQWFANLWDRLPRLRGGNVHDFNIFVDDTLGLAARRLRNTRAAAMSTANQNTLNNTYSFYPFLNGSISTENGAMLVEKSIYIDCITPLRNNQTDPSNPFYTGKILGLDTIYQMDNSDGTTTLVRGNSTDAGNPLGPFQAPIIAFSWNLPNNQLPYTYTMDDPSQLAAIVTNPVAGAGAHVLTWAKTNWLITAYPATGPTIITDPQNQSVGVGQGATLTVVAAGSAPLSYQWYYNTNSPLLNATNTSLMLTNVQASNAGPYLVVVTNSVGAVTSAVANLTVSRPLMGFASWQSLAFTPDQLADPSVSGPGATPAGDGVPNLVKYALGLAPLVPATQPLVSFRLDSGVGVLSYQRPADLADVTYRVRVCGQLSDWDASGLPQSLVGTNGSGLQIWEAHDRGPSLTNRFFQLQIQN